MNVCVQTRNLEPFQILDVRKHSAYAVPYEAIFPDSSLWTRLRRCGGWKRNQ